jgi:hypothetical protein
MQNHLIYGMFSPEKKAASPTQKRKKSGVPAVKKPKSTIFN